MEQQNKYPYESRDRKEIDESANFTGPGWFRPFLVGMVADKLNLPLLPVAKGLDMNYPPKVKIEQDGEEVELEVPKELLTNESINFSCSIHLTHTMLGFWDVWKASGQDLPRAANFLISHIESLLQAGFGWKKEESGRVRELIEAINMGIMAEGGGVDWDRFGEELEE